MDLEGLVLSTLAVAVAPAHGPSDEGASVEALRAAQAACGFATRGAGRQAHLAHELPGRGHAGASPVAAATCRIYLRNAERDAGTGFGLDPYHVVKQPSGRADVLAQQGRFALVRGKVSA